MALPWYTHATPQRLLRLDLSIMNESPLRIGAGKAPPLRAVDLPVVTIKLPRGEVPYIPGSSLKGIIRSTCEFIARSSGIEGVCSAGDCGNKYLDEAKEITYYKALDNALRRNDIEEVKRILGLYCIICKTFGSNSFGSHVDFQDAYPSGDVTLGLRSGIAINRRSGAVKSGPYEIEYVEPGHEFLGYITIRNLPNYLVGLLLLALDYLNAGIVKLGGFKSRGFGKVTSRVIRMDGYVIDETSGMFIPLSDVKQLKALDESDGDVEINLSDIHKTLDNFKRRWLVYVQTSKGGKHS
ncbi:MAG: CRISPR-associated RAMP protein Csx7 [Thermoproteota archaeon]